MQKITVEALYDNKIIFFRLAETLRNMICITQKFFPEITFIVLKINNVRLKVEGDSVSKTLFELYEERMFLLTNGRQKELDRQYRFDGIL
jgi:hypothetical protein